MRTIALKTIACCAIVFFWACQTSHKTNENASDTRVQFVVSDSGQDQFYNETGEEISKPTEEDDLYGQDAQFESTAPAFKDNGDGTITDLNTGLMWQKTPDFQRHPFYEAFNYVKGLKTGGYNDWRLPTIKELYSIANFNGELSPRDMANSTPYIDTNYFDFEYDSHLAFAGQYWSSTKYVKGPIQNIQIEGAFGFNFADGHIKSYETGLYFNGQEGVRAPGCFVRAVRGKENVYGVNDFMDNNDGTITDKATHLMWQQSDDGHTYNWKEALIYAKNSELAGYTDWRLPNTKELQSIVDYDKKDIPAIDENFFTCTNKDSWFWTSTTQGDFKNTACYIAFGKAYSKDNSKVKDYYDWHGAGAQRSDPKAGNIADYLMESINAADSIRIENYVRLVRTAD